MTFHANCLFLEKPKGQSLFSKKKRKKNISKCRLLKFLSRMLSVKTGSKETVYEVLLLVINNLLLSYREQILKMRCTLFNNDLNKGCIYDLK